MSISGVGLNSGYNPYDSYSANGYASTAGSSNRQVHLTGGNGTAQAVAGTAANISDTTGAAANSAGTYGSADIQMMKRMGDVECQTCKSRTYQDASTDAGVSFKAPGHIDPGSSGAVVRGHEQEHVANEQARARSEGKRVLSQSVRIFTSVCSECGRAYVSGGETRTVTASDNSKSKAVFQYKRPIGQSGTRMDRTV